VVKGVERERRERTRRRTTDELVIVGGIAAEGRWGEREKEK